jgi:hypothetical protein
VKSQGVMPLFNFSEDFLKISFIFVEFGAIFLPKRMPSIYQLSSVLSGLMSQAFYNIVQVSDYFGFHHPCEEVPTLHLMVLLLFVVMLDP